MTRKGDSTFLEWVQKPTDNFNDLIRNLALKDVNKFAEVPRHVKLVRSRMELFLDANIRDRDQFITTLKKSEEAHRKKKDPEKLSFDHALKDLLKVYPDIKASSHSVNDNLTLLGTNKTDARVGQRESKALYFVHSVQYQ
jgi:hypothetical protein